MLDDSVIHHGYLVGHGHRLELVVCHVDRGRLQSIVKGAQLAAHDMAELGIKRAERLIHHEGFRLSHDRTSERNPLPVAA